MCGATWPPTGQNCRCWCAARRCPPRSFRCRLSPTATHAEGVFAMADTDTRYTRDHEWVRLDGDIATVGITDHAQEALGDVVFVELPEVDRMVEAGEACAVVESVKAASDVYAPLAGKVVETNQAVADEPALVNSDAQGEG